MSWRRWREGRGKALVQRAVWTEVCGAQARAVSDRVRGAWLGEDVSVRRTPVYK